MTILQYQLAHSINGFRNNNWFWTTFTKFVLEWITILVEFTIPLINTGPWWSFIGKNLIKFIETLLLMLFLACRRNTYLWRHPTNNIPADNAIFKNRAQNLECSYGCVERSLDLLKPNVANILLFNFYEQKFIQHGPITIAIDCNGLSLLIFEEKWPNYDWTKIRKIRAGFLCPKCDNFACLHTRKDQNELHLKRWFFCQNRYLP